MAINLFIRARLWLCELGFFFQLSSSTDVRMASSVGAFSAADSRGVFASSSVSDYRMVLPPLPSGTTAINTVFLHCDTTGRPYRIEDFKVPLETVGVNREISAIGAYEMNHLWIATMKTIAAKRRLLDAKEIAVKGKRCVILDPCKAEVRLKIHWLPFPLADSIVRSTLEAYGKVEEMARETWREQTSRARNLRLRLCALRYRRESSSSSSRIN